MSSYSATPVHVEEIVPLRRHVCIPGDAVLALDSEAVVGIGSELYTISYPDDSNRNRMKAIVFSKHCAPLEKSLHRSFLHVPYYSMERPSYRRYMCHPGDPVIGIIVRKMSPHYYYLYIGGTALIYMDALAFDGASKANHPRLSEGTVVYGFIQHKKINSSNSFDQPMNRKEEDVSSGEVSMCEADSLDIEMSCVASVLGLPHKDWTSSEAVFGPLSGGRLLTVSIPYANSLLEEVPTALSSSTALEKKSTEKEKDTNKPNSSQRKRGREEKEKNEQESGEDVRNVDEFLPASYLIHLLGKRVPFEICIGRNGMIWVKGQNSVLDLTVGVKRTMAVCACILEGQLDSTKTEIENRVEKYFPT